VAVADFIAPWQGAAYRHIPAHSPYGILDFRYAGRSPDNRWNRAGQPTLYLAGDYGVVLAEHGRHFDHERAARDPGYLQLRELYRLDVTVDALVDLRNLDLCRLLSLRDPPACFLDKALARAIADYLRQSTRAQGLLMPSVVFLDDPSRWSCILFLEKLPARPEQFIRAATLERIFRVEPPASTGG
jgi:RES domain-containing protein